jgi:hypothetical protein
MRHFISYSEDGQLVGVHTHKFARGGLGGWPENYDLENGLEATNDAARSFAQRLIEAHPGRITGFVKYDCACPATAGSCTCPNMRRIDHVANEARNELVAKPAVAILVDGATWDGSSEVIRAEATAIVLKVQCAEAPDGAIVILTQARSPRLWSPTDPIELAFTDGETPEQIIYAPPRSMTGLVQFYGPCVTAMNMPVVGWA